MFEHFGDIGGAEQLLQLLALALPVQPVQHHTHVHALEDDDRSCALFMTNYYTMIPQMMIGREPWKTEIMMIENENNINDVII